MYKRTSQAKIEDLATKYKVILVTGPRQSGKTTLVKSIFSDYEYKNLEIPDQRLAAKEDPRKFLKLGSGSKLIIDEIQEVPELASYIQVEVDEQEITSQFVLTGSQNLKISQTVSQSLAGRVAQFELFPLSYKELSEDLKERSTLKHQLYGFYPGLHKDEISPTDFYRDYVDTYITRDVRDLKQINNLSNFQRLMQLLAGRVGQVLNKSSLANDIGVDVKTIDSWISILEASYIIFRVSPYFENFGKRLTKSPKLYFYDVGLASYLLGIDSVEELDTYFNLGSLFENLVVADCYKQISHKRLNQNIYFWRDKNGIEADLLIDKGVTKSLIEVKASQTYKSGMSKNISKISEILSEKHQIEQKIVYDGNIEQIVKDVELVNWRNHEVES